MSKTPRFDPMATVMSAVANASRVPATRSSLLEIIRTGAGEPSHVRAVFGDVALSVLMRVAIATDLPSTDLARAYVRARRDFAASSGEMDEFAADLGVSAETA